MAVKFEPLLILPEQLHETSTWPAQPEKRLMLAVLEEAVLTLTRNAEKRDIRAQRRVREVTSWVAEDAPDDVFSFENICAVLRLDPTRLRAGMLRIATGAPAAMGLRRMARRMSGERHRVVLDRAARR